LVLRKIPNNLEIVEYKKQLIRSSSSIGANLWEADAALTKKDFINKLVIARKEAKESHYWLRLFSMTLWDCKESFMEIFPDLEKESGELVLILSAIIGKTRQKDQSV
jgi:four helix bundle protein